MKAKPRWAFACPVPADRRATLKMLGGHRRGSFDCKGPLTRVTGLTRRVQSRVNMTHDSERKKKKNTEFGYQKGIDSIGGFWNGRAGVAAYRLSASCYLARSNLDYRGKKKKTNENKNKKPQIKTPTPTDQLLSIVARHRSARAWPSTFSASA